jgi:hypothetical protein
MTKFHITVTSIFIRDETYENKAETLLLRNWRAKLADHKDTIIQPTQTRPNGFRHLAPSLRKEFFRTHFYDPLPYTSSMRSA